MEGICIFVHFANAITMNGQRIFSHSHSLIHSSDMEIVSKVSIQRRAQHTHCIIEDGQTIRDSSRATRFRMLSELQWNPRLLSLDSVMTGNGGGELRASWDVRGMKMNLQLS